MPYTPGPWFLNDECIEANGPEGPRDVTVATVNLALPGNVPLLVNAPSLVDQLAQCADWLGQLSNCTASDDCLLATRALLKAVTGDEYHIPPENSDG